MRLRMGWFSQPTVSLLHNWYFSWHWLTFRFFLIWYVGQWLALPVIPWASNGPSSCLWYDEWPTKLPIENVISLESCDMQLFNCRLHMCVTSGYCISQASPSCVLWCIKWTIQLLVIWWVFHWASCWVSYITGKLWYAAVQQYTLDIQWAQNVLQCLGVLDWLRHSAC